MDNFLTGLRVLDIEHGLREIQPTAIIEGEMANTLLLGKAANLALHIRGLNVLDDMTALRYAAAEMGIRSTELDSVLRELATLGWVRLRDSGAKINRVEVLVQFLFRTRAGRNHSKTLDQRIEASGCRRVHMRLLGRRDGWRDIKTLITALTEFEHNEEAEAERVA